MYAQAILFTKTNTYSFETASDTRVRPQTLAYVCREEKKRVHICAQHKAAQHTQIYTQSRFTSLTQMSGFLVAFRGIKSISAQVTAILQKPA